MMAREARSFPKLLVIVIVSKSNNLPALGTHKAGWFLARTFAFLPLEVDVNTTFLCTIDLFLLILQRTGFSHFFPPYFGKHGFQSHPPKVPHVPNSGIEWFIAGRLLQGIGESVETVIFAMVRAPRLQSPVGLGSPRDDLCHQGLFPPKWGAFYDRQRAANDVHRRNVAGACFGRSFWETGGSFVGRSFCLGFSPRESSINVTKFITRSIVRPGTSSGNITHIIYAYIIYRQIDR